ncbi:putative dual specificity protein phosphatase DSP8 [Phalaenopsis equestris]|uniref:putative dual specificity protein phosphatase DSP8 n=1 Tax=Phalaenopsis equestris TaxID=78828 RepID=UPI0009E45867|nr:putative dual specificity protein phosphatase DSP8 [Phalaenopsis equestris]XP_020592187.1 putative dual specificity protein phosphatase DSP8 [Phalaenopsis equestris]
MRISELEEGIKAEEPGSVDDGRIGAFNPKRTIVGVGARFLFYPTLLYNVLRNKIQVEFRWWDEVDQFLLLGAVPFPGDIPHLKQLGVGGVVTLNEPYETLVPTSLYQAYGIEHLVLPTRDYLFAPSFGDICRAVDFIHRNVSRGKTTYVHCKAGRGRSTTIVLCYLVKYRRMTPSAAYEHVRVIRPRVLLASSQWQAVQKYYHLAVEKNNNFQNFDNSLPPPLALTATTPHLSTFEDSSFVMVSKSDLDGYDGNSSNLWAELSLVYRMQFASQAAIARLSCLWLRCHDDKKRGVESCSLEADQMGMMGLPCLMTGVVVKL